MKSIKLYLILIICLISVALLGQNRKIDSLVNLVKTNKEDTNKVNALNNLAVELRKYKLDTALIVGKEGLILATKLNWKKGIGFSNHILGVISYMKDDKIQSMTYNNSALKVWRLLSNSSIKSEAAYGKLYIAKTSITNANIFIDQANYTKALEQSFTALKTVEQLGDKKVQGVVLGNIGNIYHAQNDFTKALDYYNKALVVGSELKDPIFVLNQLNSIASCYRNTKQTDKALEYYTKNLNMAEDLGIKPNIAGSIGNIGLIYLEQKKYADAINNFNKALAIAKEVGDNGLIIFNLTNLGSIYRRTGKYNDAEQKLKDALEIAEKIGEPKYLMAIEDNLGNLYDDSGKPKLALEHYKNYIIYRDSISNQKNLKELYRSELNYEFEKKEISTKAEQDKKDALAKEEKQKQKIVIGLVSFVLILVVLFSFFLYKRFRITNHQKLIIEQQKIMVDKAYESLHEKNKEVIDSINYAKRIQTALLPTYKYISKHIKK